MGRDDRQSAELADCRISATSSRFADAGLWRQTDVKWALVCSAVLVITAAPAMLNATPDALCLGVVLGGFLTALSVIDIRSFRLPDVLTLPLIMLGLAVTAYRAPEDLVWRCMAALAGYATLCLLAYLYRRARGRNGLGLGDAKLFAAAGALVGLEGLPSTLLLASVSALAVAIVASTLGAEIEAETRIPFGPFLALGMWLVWLYGAFV